MERALLSIPTSVSSATETARPVSPKRIASRRIQGDPNGRARFPSNAVTAPHPSPWQLLPLISSPHPHLFPTPRSPATRRSAFPSPPRSLTTAVRSCTVLGSVSAMSVSYGCFASRSPVQARLPGASGLLCENAGPTADLSPSLARARAENCIVGNEVLFPVGDARGPFRLSSLTRRTVGWWWSIKS